MDRNEKEFNFMKKKKQTFERVLLALGLIYYE